MLAVFLYGLQNLVGLGYNRPDANIALGFFRGDLDSQSFKLLAEFREPTFGGDLLTDGLIQLVALALRSILDAHLKFFLLSSFVGVVFFEQ